ncbi:MAG: site-2 protease family protein [Planctomycetota bacterium JB042]
MADAFTALNFGKLAILLLAVALHEAAHAFVANACGDGTAKARGRVTLNPIPHLDPVMSVLLPALLLFSGSPFIFGAGKPVPVVKENLRHPARDFALIAVAGPLTNLLQALIFTGLFVQFGKAGSAELASQLFRFGIFINILLAIFNLIPIPPLDGSRFLAYLLPRPVQSIWYRLDAVGFLVLILLMVWAPPNHWGLENSALQQILRSTFEPTWDWWTDTYGGWL